MTEATSEEGFPSSFGGNWEADLTLPEWLSSAPEGTEVNPQVQIKTQAGRIWLFLPANPSSVLNPLPWTELWEQLQQCLAAGERFWQEGSPVYLVARDRLLDVRQLQAIADTLTQAQMILRRVYTTRRQTAVAAATAGYGVEQYAPMAPLSPSIPGTTLPLDPPLYTEGTIRAGVEVRHRGTVVVLGDVNPGGSVVADGDILVWGRLRGTAHAGAQGNRQCRIMALRMEPTQLRLASQLARLPETTSAHYPPEVAYIDGDTIAIAPAEQFARLALRRS